jgi:hypothetical protein
MEKQQFENGKAENTLASDHSLLLSVSLSYRLSFEKKNKRKKIANSKSLLWFDWSNVFPQVFVLLKKCDTICSRKDFYLEKQSLWNASWRLVK